MVLVVVTWLACSARVPSMDTVPRVPVCTIRNVITPAGEWKEAGHARPHARTLVKPLTTELTDTHSARAQ